MESEAKVIQPQAGFQYDFLSNPADIVIGGGAAGAGGVDKTEDRFNCREAGVWTGLNGPGGG